MASILSERQRDDLHKSILDYLSTAGFSKTVDQFKEELPSDFRYDLSQNSSGLLVKKWTSVIRMQKKIMDLESRLAQALEESAHVHTLTGHRDSVNAVAFHPLYSVVATASDDCSIKIWDWETGELERTLKAHTKRVSDCQFNSTGTTLDDRVVSSSRDHTLRIWEVSTTHCIKVISPHDDWIRCAVPSTDGRYIITCSADHTAKIVDTASGDVKTEFRGHENVVEAAQFCPPHAVAAIRELVALKAPQGAQATAQASIVFAVTAARDKTVKIWDAIRGQCLHTLIGHDDWVRSIVFHPNGQYLLTASDDHSFRIWDLKTGRCTRKVEAHERFVTAMSWGRQVVSTQASDQADPNASPALVNVIATCSSDQTVKIWVPQR
ncbi:dynein regulator [Armillaria novae-zelandiae]|uniref:Dynein regulator n=1 Tax=Armillaria novae-zelandiae TaxID=153914 RepID=A0AA39PUQ3_9AGAR|nr:dynein regulator [Armillaria novae-zelandiae]